MTCLIIATGNAHKAQEIRAILGGQASEWRTLADFPEAPSVCEDAGSFSGNALKKARTLAQWLAQQPAGQSLGSDAWVLADDSGLEVDALHGAPGVHSARFAAQDAAVAANCTDADNNAKLLRLLAGVAEDARTARFRCSLALVRVGDAAHQFFEGNCEGRIRRDEAGGGGFGYDPLFVPQGYDRSFAQLDGAVKNRISHRARALEKLAQHLGARAG